MYMKASEARSQWKELLDRAVKGEVIKIERGGVEFYLGTVEGLGDGQARVVDAAITLGEHIEKHRKEPKEELPSGGTENGFAFKEPALPIQEALCKNGHLIPYGEEKCMVKGCKYAR